MSFKIQSQAYALKISKFLLKELRHTCCIISKQESEMRDTVWSVGVVCANNPLHIIVLKLFPFCTELKWEELGKLLWSTKTTFYLRFLAKTNCDIFGGHFV